MIGNYKYVKYHTQPYYCSQNINKLVPKSIFKKWNKRIAYYLVTNIQKFVSSYDNQQSGYRLEDIKKHIIYLPIFEDKKNDFDFMEKFVAELESVYIAELDTYLSVTGFKNFELTKEERFALEHLDSINWKYFNVEKLFGKSTRGKRLKSADRIEGTLPFVTAGEANEGISAFISNFVTKFSANTITIDMFGSAKYRNYDYGADDHIAVVHTENLEKYAAIFVATVLHKAAHTSKFSYARNFYAKDADELNILLPEKNGEPDYEFMKKYSLAVHKLIIKDVVIYSEQKIKMKI